MLRLLTLSLALIALINSSNIPITTATPPGINQNDKKFVQTACNSTPYPTMCYYSLSSAYSSTIKSDPIKLCLTSLNVNLKSAKSASSIVSSLLKKVAFSPEVPNILKGCLKEMKDTADELKQVFAEIIRALIQGRKNLKGGD
uniref:Pectinesterase inhibitor domain-containing protein n=1 Tax=Brassica campestris TaxID=3711 RepID=M4DBM0_BRACM